MSDKTNNPPAFPGKWVTFCGATEPTESGMTLRDYFAGQALNGRISNRTIVRGRQDKRKMTEEELLAAAENTAKRAYQYADDMLAEREKGGAK